VYGYRSYGLCLFVILRGEGGGGVINLSRFVPRSFVRPFRWNFSCVCLSVPKASFSL